MPRSRTNPQFNLETLPEGLAPWQIGHRHMAELGGGQQRFAQRLLEGAELPELRRLRSDGAIRLGPGATSRAG